MSDTMSHAREAMRDMAGRYDDAMQDQTAAAKAVTKNHAWPVLRNGMIGGALGALLGLVVGGATFAAIAPAVITGALAFGGGTIATTWVLGESFISGYKAK